MITTRHNLHAKMVLESLQAGKNVFVEKPLCLTEEELQNIILSHLSHLTSQILVGFNRRFAPLAQKMKQLLGEGPKNIVATMNAGFIPSNSWVHDLEVGGGRIIGEACHYIDLCTFLAGSKITSVCMNSMGTQSQENTDNASILLKYDNGTNAVINYFANGSKAYSKERIEAYNQEKILILDNWRILRGYGIKGFSRMKTKIDKGHKSQFRLLVESIQKGGQPIIPFDEIVNTTKASFAAIKSLKENRWIEVK
jgi:predicted dehydrogenase